MVYDLYRRPALVKGTLGTCLGQRTIPYVCRCTVLGLVKYEKTPIIILQEKWLTPTDNPMYGDRPLTLMELLRSNRRKCWTVLLMGCYYLARIKVATYASC